ncbi:MAG: hypothetical protein J6V71_01245 [Clostridia bacterium]|nr:hypothetical protein [Clostridia bacterium]
MVKNLNSFLSFALFLLLIAFSLLLAFGKGYSAVVLEGLSLYLACVVPSLLPYFFITAILSSMSITSKISNKLSFLTRRTFNVGGAVGYAFFMSIISGYPVGAKIVCDLKEKGLISKAESVRASALCSTSSPMFLINSVGLIMFNSMRFGLMLFLCHFLSSIIVGIIFSFYHRKEKPLDQPFINAKKVDNVLYESAYSSVISILVVGAIITIFYLLTSVLFSVGILTPIVSLFSFVLGNEQLGKGLTFGLFECTQGLKILSNLPNHLLAFPLSAFICGFGGLSVIMQSVAYLKKAKIKTAPFILAKIICAVINFILASFICLVCPL